MFNAIRLIAFVLLLAGCGAPPAASTQVAGNVDHGAQLFTKGENAAPPCSSCHQIVAGQFGFSLGPNLAEIGEHAATRVDSLTAEEYLHQSILDPGHYLVSGYRDIMYPDYAKHYTEEDVQDLIAYLLTL